MVRTIISAVITVMLLLQGMTLAAADILPADDSSSMPHCAGHESAGEDCSCCTGSDVLGINCAAQCSMAVSIAPTLFVAPIEKVVAGVASDDVWDSGPSYSPLNPPPIS